MDMANLIVQLTTSIATSAGVVISLYQIRRGKELREEETKRQQSKCVSVWYGEVSDELAEQLDKLDRQYYWMPVVLRNTSELPVYDAIVTC